MKKTAIMSTIALSGLALANQSIVKADETSKVTTVSSSETGTKVSENPISVTPFVTVTEKERPALLEAAKLASETVKTVEVPKTTPIIITDNTGKTVVDKTVAPGSQITVDGGLTTYSPNRKLTDKLAFTQVLKEGETLNIEQTKALAEKRGYDVTYDEKTRTVTYTAKQQVKDTLNTTVPVAATGERRVEFTPVVSTKTETKTRTVPKQETYEEEVEKVENVEWYMPKIVPFTHTDGRTLYKYDASEKRTYPSDVVDWYLINTFFVDNGDPNDIDSKYSPVGRNYFKENPLYNGASVVYKANGVTFSKVVTVNLLTGEETPIETNGKTFTITDANAPDVHFAVKYYIKGTATKEGVGVSYEILDSSGKLIQEGAGSNPHAYKLKTTTAKETKTRTVNVEENYEVTSEVFEPISLSGNGVDANFTSVKIIAPSGKVTEIKAGSPTWTSTFVPTEKGKHTLVYTYKTTGKSATFTITAAAKSSTGKVTSGSPATLSVTDKHAVKGLYSFEEVTLANPISVTTLDKAEQTFSYELEMLVNDQKVMTTDVAKVSTAKAPTKTLPKTSAAGKSMVINDDGKELVAATTIALASVGLLGFGLKRRFIKK